MLRGRLRGRSGRRDRRRVVKRRSGSWLELIGCCPSLDMARVALAVVRNADGKKL